jgi:hypothetical protein
MMTFRKSIQCGLLVVMTVMFGGCIFGSDTPTSVDREATEYMPVEEGLWWRYSIPGSGESSELKRLSQLWGEPDSMWCWVTTYEVSSTDTIWQSEEIWGHWQGKIAVYNE